MPCRAVRRSISARAGPGEAEISSTATTNAGSETDRCTTESLEAPVRLAQPGDGVGWPVEGHLAQLVAAEEEQHQLRRPPRDHHRVLAATDARLLARPVAAAYDDRDAALPGGELGGARQQLPELVLVGRRQVPRLPARLGPAQVLVVDEVLQRVREPLDTRHPVRRDARVVQLLHHLGV